MPELIPVLKRDEIARKVAAMAKAISRDYQGRQLVLIGVLKGAFIFLSDLARHLELDDVKIDFLRAASYGDGTSSSETIHLIKDIDTDIRGKDVLIVEDILDTGLTLSFLTEHLKAHNPNSIRTCAFIDKSERRKVAVDADYVGHKVKEGFLVGYGLDYAEAYRNLPDIYHLKID